MTEDQRPFLIERLRADLLGPDAPDEVLTDRPSDRYLTGILFPRRLEFGAEEDETLASATGGTTEEGGGGDEDVPHTGLYKPSAAGLSFCVDAGSDGKVEILVHVTCGTYVRINQRLDVEGNASLDALAVSPTAPRTRIEWHRTDHDFVVNVKLAEEFTPDVPLESFGLEKVSLYVTRAPLEHGWLVTVRLVNGNEIKTGGGGNDRRPDEISLFQTRLEVTSVAPARLIAKPSKIITSDADSLATALLYRQAREFATGHTCSAMWEGTSGESVNSVCTTWMPVQSVKMVSAGGAPEMRAKITAVSTMSGLDPLSAEALAKAGTRLRVLLETVPSGYDHWIKEREREVGAVPPELAKQAKSHLDRCRVSLSRMRAGIEAVESDADVRAAFLLMNQAMQQQRVWTDNVRNATAGRDSSASGGLRWYPFQLGFILQCLASIADKSSPDREHMDLLWFPTGGGKTEAYLGLIAFTAFLRRIRRRADSDKGGGVCCIMRYTLRLLTLQQFQRAAVLMLACECLRVKGDTSDGIPDLRGAAPFSIGLWVGGDATPNSLKDAVAASGNLLAPNSPKQLTTCPCCGGKLTWRVSDTSVAVKCVSPSCELASLVPEFPVLTVDELIYRDPPTLLFATVDKFAQIVRKKETRAIFNANVAPPPELIIQDELHLISGPLGTLTALYESAVDLICSRDGHRPKIIGSTATIRRADEQIRALFNRTSAQFPPPGLDIGDSCFAYVEPDADNRRYVGLTTAGRSAKFTLQAVYASLLQSAAQITDLTKRDGYYTLVGYFNALRELGGAIVLAQDDVHNSIELIAKRRGEAKRDAKEVVELTSRVSQQDIREILDRLELRCDTVGATDMLLATNMISVGVDVSRLALMVVMGQPKGISEYIQATSRVGRSDAARGLVVAVLNANKARDRAHFESFTSIHSALYRGVEATSVTPFAARARDRALHAALVAAVRHLDADLSDDPRLTADSTLRVQAIADQLAARAAIDPEEAAASALDLAEIVALWGARSAAVTSYWNDYSDSGSLLLSAELAAARNRSGLSSARAWPTLNSMRTVEASTPFRLIKGLSTRGER